MLPAVFWLGRQKISSQLKKNNKMEFLANFIRENKSIGGISIEISDKVKELWNEYKLPKLQNKCSIINADFGNLGSIVIRDIASFETETTFKYESGSYDYISIKSDCTTKILWTDYSDVEPYNRNGGLYCDGASFEHLGSPIIEKKEYREFYSKRTYNTNISFAVWGYKFNDFYKSITFGLCIEKEKVEEFLSKLRSIINKDGVA